MRFGERLRLASQNLEISRRHDEWLKNNSNAVYSNKALAFALDQLTTPTRVRKGTVSSSSLDSCRRRQQFTYLGMPELPPTPRIAQIFHTGSFMHLRWQMAGLTEGWLSEAEVPIGDNDMGLSGTMDGLSYDDRVVELKSINSNGYRTVTTFGPKDAHLMQVGAYMVAAGKKTSSIIYENKDTQDYREFEVPLTDELELLARLSAHEIFEQIGEQLLAEPLSDCEDQVGFRYTSCPYRDRCLAQRDWAHAEETANAPN